MVPIRFLWTFVVLFVADRLNATVSKKIEDSLNFLVVGDWGGLPWSPYTTEVEKAVAHQMGNFAAANDVEFVLALGDNFYFSGVSNVHDHRFQDTYNHIFTSESLSVNWYFIAGNHDHHGNVSAQIEYSKLERRWNFPTYYYPLHFTLPSGSTTVDILMLDTVILCGNSDSDELNLQPQGAENGPLADKQLAWIEEKLKNSRADYLLVTGHFPVFSIGGHGPTHCLLDKLLPLLHKYNVSAYFCGHDHNLQHLQYTQNDATVEYFVSGAANFLSSHQAHKSSVPAGSSKFFWGDPSSLGGFGFVKVTAEELTFSFHAASGKLLYKHALIPRKF